MWERVWEKVEILTEKPVMKPAKVYGLRLGLWVKVRVRVKVRSEG